MPATETTSKPEKCKHCNRPMRVPIFCDDCHRLYPVPQSVDHFALLGLPRQFDLDDAKLHESFISISRNVHPDYFGGQTPEMQRLSLRLSAQINEAYAVLKDPVLRAEYLLETAGGKSSAEDKEVPQELLSEVMTLREEIEEAHGADDPRLIETLKAQVRERMDQTMQRVAALAKAVTNHPKADQLDDLREQLNAMRYLKKLWGEFAA